MKFFYTYFFLQIAVILPGFGQKVYKGLPADLKEQKLIFLAYEQLHTDPRMQKKVLKYYEELNEKAKEANKLLVKHAKEYPFVYAISERATYKDLKEQGFKYVLNNSMMEEYNNGTVGVSPGITYYSPLYIENIETGDVYELFDIKQPFVYSYDIIMKKFIKEVDKKFN